MNVSVEKGSYIVPISMIGMEGTLPFRDIRIGTIVVEAWYVRQFKPFIFPGLSSVDLRGPRYIHKRYLKAVSNLYTYVRDIGSNFLRLQI